MWNNQGGGFDGGGFQSPGGFGTPQQSQEKKGRSRAQNVLPCTVAQVFNATHSDEKFYSDETEMLQVTIVGLVRAVKETQTRLDYEIDDMTGPPIEVKQFVDNDESLPAEERVPSMRENTYVRICGHVRSFGGKRSVVAYNMSPITDMNELTCHMLEIIHSHAFNASSGQNTNQTSYGGDNNMSMNQGSYNSGDGGNILGLTPLQNQIHQVIKNNPSDTGASVVSVCQTLRGIPEKAIKDAIDFLSSEGHIYSTIDEDHYKATDG
ncbi:replication protein A 32 kDa subunit-B isoform X1 [Patella vulgata]|uniref:replication protein A 32 kDa subunit-B isoform X1 n=2 Tax=Patella vulgata TaxID=6465 RepID=UPI00217F262B|nr:replication protein A 32 kDa subunit-B isoform X1 [Patella vulgata]